MIRDATTDDIPHLLPLMESFSSQLGEWYSEQYNPRYISRLLQTCIDSGIALTYESSGKPQGLILGLISQSIWNPNVTQVEEVAYYVSEAHRGSLSGGKLLLEYERRVQATGAQLSSLKLLYNSPELERSYNKLGYYKTETAYAKIIGD